MEYQIKNHKLEGVTYIPSPNVGGIITPQFIVNHYTAGYDDLGAINTFKNRASKVSAHIIIDRDGTVTQMVPFNRRAWHAGPSKYRGFVGMNGYAVGIEFDNIGYVRKEADGGYVDYTGKKFTPDPGQQLVAAAHPRVGSGMLYWPSYTEIQLAAGMDITRALIGKYSIEDIVTHEEIDTRGWKTDVSLNNFPQQMFKNLLRNESQDTQMEGVDQNYYVSVNGLNVRSGAGVEWDKVALLRRATFVSVDEIVGDWAFITMADDSQGWVAIKYLRRAQ